MVKNLDDDTPIIANNFIKFLNGKLNKENHLGFIVSTNEIQDNIYIPEHYNPDIKEELNTLKESGKYKLATLGELVNNGVIQISRGNEIGSQHYGSGNVPFIRTTDIVNWEIKMDTVKSVADEIYDKFKKQQDVRINDILFVNDGTFLIGRCSMITKLDVKCIIQSHLKKIRVINLEEITPYYMLFLLNTKIVQKQIETKTFVQATLSTLGNRMLELVLPILQDKNEIERISNEVKSIIDSKTDLRWRLQVLLDRSI